MIRTTLLSLLLTATACRADGASDTATKMCAKETDRAACVAAVEPPLSECLKHPDGSPAAVQCFQEKVAPVLMRLSMQSVKAERKAAKKKFKYGPMHEVSVKVVPMQS
jgi:hypothetical protein